jgi:hypothetical protein
MNSPLAARQVAPVCAGRSDPRPPVSEPKDQRRMSTAVAAPADLDHLGLWFSKAAAFIWPRTGPENDP